MNLVYLYLILAMALLFSGHVVRIIRWEYFIKIYEKPEKGSLYRGLFLGYLINMILPFHLGEIGRAYVSGKKMKNGQSFSFVTVIIDRYLDVLFVGLIFLGLLAFNHTDRVVLHSSIMYVGMSAVLIVISLLIFFFSVTIKRITKAVASIFNENIEYHILGFVFSAINGFKDLFVNLSKLKVFGSTLVMWALYITSYYSFALFERGLNSESSLKEVFIGLFGNANVSSLGAKGFYSALHLFLFLMIPNIGLLLMSFFFKEECVDEDAKNVLPLMRREERLRFLEDYFGNNRREFLSDYLKLNRNVTIIRDYSAGSNASTMLCAADNLTFFRKFAFGNDAKTLKRQCEWIEEHGKIKLPDIINRAEENSSFLYDMPYDPEAMTLFSYVHAKGATQGFLMLENMLKDLSEELYCNEIGADLDEYIHSKVTNNLKLLNSYKRFVKLSEADTIIINGVEHKNLKYYLSFLEEDKIKKILANDNISECHGDFTLENIIVCGEDYYFIDPNPNAKFGSINLDLGKILQSVHSGYEFRRLVSNVEQKGNRIDFFMTSSHAYHEFYEMYRNYLNDNYDEKFVQSVYMHEIIHYLRLLPYRIESANFAVFYAAFIEILADYEKMWGI